MSAPRLDFRLSFRLSAALARRVRAIGPDSAAARALILLGLYQAGEDLSPYLDEGAALLPLLAEAAIRAALRRALFNTGSTQVQPVLNTPGAAPIPPADDSILADLLDDPLSGVGIEV